MPQTDGAKDGRGSWEVILHNSWLVVFGGCFGFCSADLQKTNIQYSTIEFKVIDIVYIVGYSQYSIVYLVYNEPRRERLDSGT